jgi:O-acetyl-ADP-ribose deacetylase (regulator of RNase III)
MEIVRPLNNGRRIRILEGDITRIPADAIANAANAMLAGGGGVDGAIHRAGGPSIMRELDAVRPALAPLPAGRAVATGAGNLPAQYVLHAVGPVYRGGAAGEAEALASCYHECLRLAEQRACRSVSFPAISTGVYGYPKEQAAPIAAGAVLDFLSQEAQSVEEVIFVLYGSEDFRAYAALFGENRY